MKPGREKASPGGQVPLRFLFPARGGLGYACQSKSIVLAAYFCHLSENGLRYLWYSQQLWQTECPECIDRNSSVIEIRELGNHRQNSLQVKVESSDTGNNAAAEAQRIPFGPRHLGQDIERRKLANDFQVKNNSQTDFGQIDKCVIIIRKNRTVEVCMEWLNYHHLFYYWTVMREGSITAASEKLRLAQSTISVQLAKLEESLDVKLTQKVGRNLEPTDAGLLVLRYADEIFPLGREMMDSLKGVPVTGPWSLRVGIVDVVPKLVAQKLLAPINNLPEKVRLICHEGKDENLLAELAMHNLDVVLTDTPIRSGLSIKAYNHLLGECGVSFLGTQDLVEQLDGKFPYSLNNAPMLFPMVMSTLRGILDQWLDKMEIQPLIVGEFDDSALLKVFGQAGDGIFVAPTVIEKEVVQQYHVKVIGRTRDIKERFYAISVERIIKHPAVAAISEAAQQKLFFDIKRKRTK